jgi:hypothetical protein
MALCIECLPAVQEVLGSNPDLDAMFSDALCKGWRLSRESNPRPPALQANTLCKEPFKTTYYLVFRISASVATAPPSRGEVSWLNVLGRW